MTSLRASRVIAAVEAKAAAECRARSISCIVSPVDEDLLIRADQAHTEQALAHLLSNAAKFTEPGGTVTVQAVSDGEHVLLRVIDTGRGVPIEHRNVIFEPFVQVEQGLTRTAEGAGIGLTISRALARAMEGDAILEKSDSTGSTFTLVFKRGS